MQLIYQIIFFISIFFIFMTICLCSFFGNFASFVVCFSYPCLLLLALYSPKKAIAIFFLGFFIILAVSKWIFFETDLLLPILIATSFALGTINVFYTLPEMLSPLYLWSKKNFEKSFVKSATAKTLLINESAKGFFSQRAIALDTLCLNFKSSLKGQSFLPVRSKLVVPCFPKMPFIEISSMVQNVVCFIDKKKRLEEALKQVAFSEQKWKSRFDESEVALGFFKQQHLQLLEQLRNQEQAHEKELEPLKKPLEKQEGKASASSSYKSLQNKFEKQGSALQALKKECKQRALDMKKAEKRLEEKEKELKQARLALFRMQERSL